MRRRTPEVKIIWQSRHFPWMTFTDVQLAVFRERYPRIPKWQPFLEELETWVAANLASSPDKIPSARGWGNFLNNAAKRRDRDIIIGRRRPDGMLVVDKNQSNYDYYGSGAKPSNPIAVRDVLKKLARELDAQEPE